MRPKAWRLAQLVFILFMALLALASSLPVQALDPPSPWLENDLPSLEKISDLGADEINLLVKSINTDCQQRKVITRPARTLPLQSEISQTGCVTDTAFGAIFNGTYLQRPGSTVYGNITTNSGGTAVMVPIPYSPTGLVIGTGTFSGNYLSFINNLEASLSSSAIFTGEVTHQLPAAYTSLLKDRAGHPLVAQVDTISFSANGNWMVVDLPSIGTARVDLATLDVLPFGEAFNYDIGVGVGMRTAISQDGRYAVTASKNFNSFKLYDLSTCGPVPNTTTTKVNCASKDMLPFLKQSVNSFSSIVRMRFRGDYTLDMYINSAQNSNLVTSHQVMAAPGQTAAGFDYLALGDSFASGEGAYEYKSITDTTENKCHLSQQSYPYLISSALNYGQYESVACSGAKIEDLSRKDGDYEGQVNDGYRLKDRNVAEILSNFLPGYTGQKEFIQHYTPDIITLSAVGNDVGFSDKIKRCLDTDTCYSNYEDRLEIVNEINAQFYRLIDMYTQVKSATDPRSRLYVIGYPQIAQPDGNCALNVHLNNDEIKFSQQLVSYLNSVVKAASANAGVFYVDVEDAFTGHRLCETDSWNVAVNGLTAGDDQPGLLKGPVGNESFHPNAFGHNLLKTKILEQTNNLTTPMPIADPTITIGNPAPTLPLLQAPKTNRTIKIIRNITGTNEGVIHYGETWVQSYSGISPFAKAGSAVNVWINSDPTYLGDFVVDPSGNLSLSITMPASVQPGFHTLHIYGQNTSGEDVDLYQIVFVSGIDTPSCAVNISSIDADQDGIDDACDAVISQPPIIVSPPDPLPLPHGDPLPPDDPPQDEQTPITPSTTDDQSSTNPPTDSSTGTPTTTTDTDATDIPQNNSPDSQQTGDTTSPTQSTSPTTDHELPVSPNNSQTDVTPQQSHLVGSDSATIENLRSVAINDLTLPLDALSSNVTTTPQVAAATTRKPQPAATNVPAILQSIKHESKLWQFLVAILAISTLLFLTTRLLTK